MQEKQSHRIWFVSELYYPEDTSTGYFLTRLAEHLAESNPTGAICAQPSYSKRGVAAPSRELHNGVDIHRFRGTKFAKDNLLGRIVNVLTINLAVFLYCLRLFKRGDRVLVVTNPPFLPFVVAPVCWFKRAKCVLRVEDVYPDALVAAGFASSKSFAVTVWSKIARRFYARFDRVIVLGRDMHDLIVERASARIELIRNWADNQDVIPLKRQENPILAEMGLANQFIVQYAGNMGRTHDLETLISAAELLLDTPGIHFLFSGWGAKRKWLEETAKGIANLSVLPHQPRERLPYLLTACDVSVISLVPGMSGISVPSRLYNILAAGRPVIAVTDENSEIARVIREENVGWVVKPRDAAGFAAAVREACEAGPALIEMGSRARLVAEQKYSFAVSAQDYAELFASL